jgi:large subunit ribosomal protein L6
MSRVGKKPVVLPSGVKAELKESKLSITGPKGTLTLDVHPKVTLNLTDAEITVTVVKEEDKRERALWGLTRALVQNLVEGVTKGFEKKLEVNGVGFKVAVAADKLVMSLGFSHPVNVEIPSGLSVKAEKNLISISGVDKEMVCSFAAKIRALKKPEPYKGKGFRYEGEVIRRKQGKKICIVNI